MTESIQAIYEDGVLRPLDPVDLQEHEVVALSILKSNSGTKRVTDVSAQRNVLLRFVSKMEAAPDDNLQDGFSNRDHDRLIYGE